MLHSLRHPLFWMLLVPVAAYVPAGVAEADQAYATCFVQMMESGIEAVLAQDKNDPAFSPKQTDSHFKEMVALAEMSCSPAPSEPAKKALTAQAKAAWDETLAQWRRGELAVPPAGKEAYQQQQADDWEAYQTWKSESGSR